MYIVGPVWRCLLHVCGAHVAQLDSPSPIEAFLEECCTVNLPQSDHVSSRYGALSLPPPSPSLLLFLSFPLPHKHTTHGHMYMYD